MYWFVSLTSPFIGAGIVAYFDTNVYKYAAGGVLASAGALLLYKMTAQVVPGI